MLQIKTQRNLQKQNTDNFYAILTNVRKSYLSIFIKNWNMSAIHSHTTTSSQEGVHLGLHI